MKSKKIYFLLLILVSLSGNLKSQTVYQYLKLGDKNFTTTDYYSSLYYYNKAKEVDSNIIEIDFKIAACYRLINDYKNAYINYEKVLKTDKYKNFPLSEFWMGIVSKYLGNYNIAKNHFQRFNDRYSYTDYYKTKCIQEIASVNWAINNSIIQPNKTITRLDRDVNSVYSEFAGVELSDSIFIFSSIKENETAKNSKSNLKEFTSHVYTLKNNDDKWVENHDLFKWLDTYDKNIANGSFSADRLRFYFNVCEYINTSELRCDIYLSEFKNDAWQEPIKLPEPINLEKYTNTQPNEGNNNMLYFVSDRLNGEGKLDIWFSQRNEDGTYGEVKNIGKNINSMDNEITPYFDNASATLYFSSDWHEGYGGYDVFYSNYINNSFSNPINANLPINSSFNDIYFNLNLNNSNIGFLASNRKGSLFLKGESCCNDIYKFEKQKVTESKSIPVTISTIHQIDSTIIHTTSNTIVINDSNPNHTISRLEKLLPVTVYFHNDIPNPRSNNDSTNLNYLTTYQEYTSMKNEYIQAFQKVDDKNAANSITNLFTNYVDKGYEKLLLFSTILKDALLKGNKIQLTIEGYCSPLALNNYNIHLANRRIASLKNYLAEFDNGFYKSYLKNNQLILINAPFGEEKAQKGISDDRLDTKNSVYNPIAALERKVAIIAIEIIP